MGIAYPFTLNYGAPIASMHAAIYISGIGTSYFGAVHKDLEPFVSTMYRKLEPFVEVLTNQVLSSSKIASPGPIYLI